MDAERSAGSRTVRLTLAEFQAASETYEGFCIECREITNSGVEPDARGYECEACGSRAVYGMDEALLMGAFDIAEERKEG